MYYLKSSQSVKDLALDVMLARQTLLKAVGIDSLDDLGTETEESAAVPSEKISEKVKN